MTRVWPAAALVLGITLSGAAGADVRLVGSGASFPFPLYAAWFQDFSAQTEGVTVDYQSKGSGAGIQDLLNGVVDFAGSDAAMSDEEIERMERGVVLLPMTAGEIVIAYNLPGVDELRLPRDVYADIFLAEIERWNDPRIAEANEGVDLPDTPITVVVRSDSSGTTFNFTNHLSAISEDFASGPGAGTTVQWPDSNRIVRAPKNDGVTAQVKQNPGGIGYVEYGYAKLTGTPTAILENRAGSFVEPGTEAGSRALATAAFDEHMRAFVTDPEGEDAYPIVTFSWLLFPAAGHDAETREAIQQLIEYGLTTGQEMAPELGYVPLPEEVVAQVREAAARIE